MQGNSWFGSLSAVLDFLRSQNADKAPDGESFAIGGKGVVTGLGGQEVIVPPETVYYVDGLEAPLAASLFRAVPGVRKGVAVRML